jgi:hypothetical protein
MRNFKTLFIFSLLTFIALSAFSQKKTLSGYIKDQETGEELIGVSVFVKELSTGGVTNAYGFYSLTLAPGKYNVVFSYIGYQSVTQVVDLAENNTLNINLSSASKTIDEVVVTAKKEDEEENVQSVTPSVINVNIEQIKKLPTLFGEPDVIKTIQLLPGVVSAGEGTTGFFVRGGSADQNLILIDEAPVYDASHFFGLFSVFNADVIKDSQLHKGGIAPQFGGRLSSILDVRTKDGNTKNLGISASIGSIASKIMIEAPIVKDKSSFIFSARRSYFDVLMKMFQDKNNPNAQNSVFFYDLNAKINFKPSNKDRFFVAGYLGRDVMQFGTDASFGWGNKTGTVRWNHLYSDKTFSNTTFVFSNFDYRLDFDIPSQGFTWDAGLKEISLKQDVNHYFNTNHSFTLGASVSYRIFEQGKISPKENSILLGMEMPKQRALDYAIYFGHEWNLTDKLAFNYGLRFSMFQSVGEATIREYEDITDNINPEFKDTHYDSFETIRFFANPEPRFSARYTLSPQSSVKIGYNRMVQYIHLMSNSTVPIPFNTWAPSTKYLDPQKADQVSIGYFKNLKDNAYEFSLEAYYKDMKKVTDFADNASILLNPNVATEYRQGDSRSYGLELFVQKKKGKLTGFVSYTLSKTVRQVPGVNADKEFVANYDRRHNLNLVATYDISKRFTFGGTFTYGTGRPITLPGGSYDFDGYNPDYYTERNAYRMPDFHRLDLSVTYSPKKNERRKWKSQWVLSVYNVYNRQNPFTIYTRTKRDDKGNIVGDGTEKEARMVYLFPILPSINYNIKF